MFLTDLDLQSTRLRLFGPRAVLEVENPLPGVMRVRHAPCADQSSFDHPRLPAKSSFAVQAQSPQTLQVKTEPGVVQVSGAGVRLEVSRESGKWRLLDAGNRALAECLEVDGESVADYPRTRFHTRLSLHAPAGEAYLGLGERMGTLNKRGGRYVFWNTDVMPHAPDTDPMYVSIPLLVGLKNGVAWGLFLDESWRLEVDVARDAAERVTWQSRGPELDAYLLVGPTLADVLGRYTALTGRAPLPPLWALGAQQSRWGYESAADIRAVIQGYRRRELPLDVIYLDIDHQDGYRTLTWDPARYPDPKQLCAEAAEEGVRLVPIVDPALKAEAGYPLYDEALARGHLVRTDRGEVLQGEVWPRPAVFPDFTRAPVRRFWADAHRSFLEQGVAGFWIDMNEPSNFKLGNAASAIAPSVNQSLDVNRTEGLTLPYDARHGEKRHLEVHNVYALGMAQATVEGLTRHAPGRRPFVLSRAGFAGIQRYAWLWTGDNSSLWQHLEASIPMLLSLGLSGIPFAGADIPGFLGRASGELLVRWMELGGFYPLMRNHAARGTPFQEPWRMGEPFLSQARRLLERRYRLLPTLYTLAEEASRTGAPPLRPLAWSAPGDGRALGAFDQLVLGDALLVAPVVRPEQEARLVYLPAGEWLSFAGLEEVGPVLRGEQHVVAPAPLGKTPLFLRQGHGVALTAPTLHTRTANWPSLAWHFHAGPQLRAELYEDVGEGSGDFRRTTLVGGFDGAQLWLEQQVQGALPLERRRVSVIVHGLRKKAASVKAPGVQSSVDAQGDLHLEMAADFTRVEAELS